MTDTITLDAHHAAQILHQLTICSYLLRDGGDPVQAELHATLNASLDTVDTDQFTEQLGHSRRYLDARLANARYNARKEATNQDRVGPKQTSTLGPNGLVIFRPNTNPARYPSNAPPGPAKRPRCSAGRPR